MIQMNVLKMIIGIKLIYQIYFSSSTLNSLPPTPSPIILAPGISTALQKKIGTILAQSY